MNFYAHLEHHITTVDTLCQFVKKREIPQHDKKIKVQTFLATLPDVIQSFNQDLLMKERLDLALEALRKACVNNNLHEGPIALKNPNAPLQSFSITDSTLPLIQEPPIRGSQFITTIETYTQRRIINRRLHPESYTYHYSIDFHRLNTLAPQIVHLNLDNIKSFEALKTVIAHCPNLETLSLKNCMLNPDSAIALIDLDNCRNIKKLDLSYNDSIGTEGAKALIENLRGKFEYLGCKPFFELHTPLPTE